MSMEHVLYDLGQAVDIAIKDVEGFSEPRWTKDMYDEQELAAIMLKLIELKFICIGYRMRPGYDPTPEMSLSQGGER